MLVKVKPDIFINTEHVIYVDLKPANDLKLDYASGTVAIPNAAIVYLLDKHKIINVSPEAAAFLMNQMEAASAAILPGEPEYIAPGAPTSQPLTSRIAVLLRDEFPQGATIDQLMDVLHLDYRLIVNALMSLCTERVAQFHETEDHYYHALHYPKIYAPECEVDLLDITPFQSALRDGEFQCIECKAQSCATCVTASACCKCNCPSFTLRVTPNPDPLAEGVALASSPAEDTEKTAIRTTANLSCSCGSLFPNRIHLRSCALSNETE